MTANRPHLKFLSIAVCVAVLGAAGVGWTLWHTSQSAHFSGSILPKTYLVGVPLLPLIGLLFKSSQRRMNLIMYAEFTFLAAIVAMAALGLLLLPRDMSIFVYVSLWRGLETLGVVGALGTIAAVGLSRTPVAPSDQDRH
jgi:hypothetical protein